MIQVQQGQRIAVVGRVLTAAKPRKTVAKPCLVQFSGGGFARVRYPTTLGGNDYSQAGLNIQGVTPDNDGSTELATTALIPQDAPLGKSSVVVAVTQESQEGARVQKSGTAEIEIVAGTADTVQELVNVEVVLS